MGKEHLLEVDKNENEIALQKGVRWWIWSIILLINTLLLINVGIFSAASSKIKKTLDINSQSFGLFGSLNATGRIIGTFIFMGIVNKWNRKYVIIISLYFNALSIFSFTLTNNLTFLYFSRTINGVCQVFAFIYFPIWIDQFGVQKQKTIMLSLHQLTTPVGMVIGYCLNILLGSEKWRWGFNIEAIAETLFTTILLLVPMKYFSKNWFFKCHFDGIDRIENGQSRASIFHIPPSVEINKVTNAPIVNKPGNSIIKNWKSILLNKIFMLTVLYKSISQLICMGLGYWLTDYLENGLNVSDSVTKWSAYIIVIVVGPMIGLAFGGLAGSLAGGYEKKRSVLVIFVLHVISCFIGIWAPITDSVFVFDIIMVFFFVFNSAVIPVMTGVILWSMPKNWKGMGNGISSLITTFLGKFPAPLIYGIAQENYSYISKKIGMYAWMSTSFLGILFWGFVVMFRYRDKDDNKENTSFDKKNEDKKIMEHLRNSINHEAISEALNNLPGPEFEEYTDDTNAINNTNGNEMLEK